MQDLLGFLGHHFWWGVLGGFLAELLQWFGIRHSLHRGLPDWSKSSVYWVVTVAMVFAGGGLVLMYVKSGVDLTPILAVNLGASAPLVLGRLVQQLPPLEPGNVG